MVQWEVGGARGERIRLSTVFKCEALPCMFGKVQIKLLVGIKQVPHFCPDVGFPRMSIY